MVHIFRSPLRFSFSSERHRQRSIVSLKSCLTRGLIGGYRGISAFMASGLRRGMISP